MYAFLRVSSRSEDKTFCSDASKLYSSAWMSLPVHTSVDILMIKNNYNNQYFSLISHSKHIVLNETTYHFMHHSHAISFLFFLLMFWQILPSNIVGGRPFLMFLILSVPGNALCVTASSPWIPAIVSYVLCGQTKLKKLNFFSVQLAVFKVLTHDLSQDRCLLQARHLIKQ